MSENIGSYFVFNNEIKDSTTLDEDGLNPDQLVYEVIRVIDSIPLFEEKHIHRLKQSAEKTGFPYLLTHSEVSERISKLIAYCNLTTGNVKITIQYSPDKSEGIFYAYVIPTNYPSAENYESGITTLLYHAERNNPNAKVADIELRRTLDEIITKNNVYEVILFDSKNMITEGSRSNFFVVDGSEILTPPVENVLPGVTRSIIIQLCNELGYEVVEKEIPKSILNSIDAAFITGTSPKVLPINKIDSLKLHSASHSMIKNIMHAYDKLIEYYIKQRKSR